MASFYATAIKMKNDCFFSDNLLEIDKIFLASNGWYPKETIYDYLIQNPSDIKVKNEFGPVLIACKSINGEKYVKSSPNETKSDNLLSLERYWTKIYKK